MLYREKQLYHQVHPLKLGTDISTSIVSTYFFWVHDLWPAILTTLVPPVAVSVIMLSTMDFSWIKRSAVGRYLAWEMTPATQALRLAGALVMIFGAWYQQWWGIVLGLLIVLFGWLRGLLLPPRRRSEAVSAPGEACFGKPGIRAGEG
jgi:hypothetical protein